MAEKLLGSAIQSGTITTTQLSSALNSTISQGGGPKILSLTYPGDDTAANSVGGQTVVVNGTGFQTNVQIYVNGNAVPSVTYTNANSVSFTTPALNAATYPLYLTNTDDGGTAILIPGLQISGEPTWSTNATLPQQGADETWSISLSATSDSNVSYSLASGSSLPSGISLAANGLISGTLSSPPNDDTTYNFTVLATDEENQDASRAFSVNVTVGEGVAFANTVLLLHADGTNNQNNHTFLDSSNNNFTITRNGNATQGSFSPFSQTGWSGYFDGNGDSLSIAANTALALDSSNFTIEAWVYADSAFATDPILESRSSSSSSAGYAFLVTSDGKLNVYNSGGFLGASTTALQRNIWYHVALVRSGTGTNETTFYINGTSSGTITLSANLTDGSTQVTRIGGSTSAGENWNGYISNLRILKGTALYTSNFTPPTAPLTNIANTSLLTLQSNRFVDNSDNNFTITRNGDAKIVPYSPFAPTVAYSTANVGGSAYFDGSGDYLSWSGSTIGSQPYTAELWFYVNNLSGIRATFGTTVNAGFNLRIASSTSISVDAYNNSAQSFTVPTMTVGQWYHLVAVRNASNQTTVFLNGVRSSTGAVSISTTYGAISKLGQSAELTDFSGYISGARLVIGSAVYDPTSSTISVPSTPPTTVTNTNLLVNFTNAGIFDSTAKNVLETVGDAKVNTSVVKYGTGSMYFDGNGDALKVYHTNYPSLVNFPKSGYKFTIEMWVYLNSLTNPRSHLIGLWTGGTQVGWTIDVNTSGNVFFANNGQGPTVSLSSAITTGSWIHLAFVNDGSIITVYKDGTSVGNTANYTPTDSTLPLYIGMRSDSTLPVNGYIDDLRISNFVRYSSNFTPPASAFKDR